jgi:hypothetical protein
MGSGARRMRRYGCPMRRWWAGLVLMACVRVAPAPPPPPPAAPPPPPPIRVPEGCLANASGAYRPATTSPLRYEASDDGGTLVMVAFSDPVDAGRPARRFSRDGGLPWLVKTRPADGPTNDGAPTPQATLVATRTPDGFLGTVTVSAGPDAGCVPTFAARVVACGDDGLTLETMPNARFDSSCRPLDGGATMRQRLQRVERDAGTEAASEDPSPDASIPDAG